MDQTSKETPGQKKFVSLSANVKKEEIALFSISYQNQLVYQYSKLEKGKTQPTWECEQCYNYSKLSKQLSGKPYTFSGPITAVPWEKGYAIFGLNDKQEVIQAIVKSGDCTTTPGNSETTPPSGKSATESFRCSSISVTELKNLGSHFSSGDKFQGSLTAIASIRPDEQIDIFGLNAKGELLQLTFQRNQWYWFNLANYYSGKELFLTTGFLSVIPWTKDGAAIFGFSNKGDLLQVSWNDVNKWKQENLGSQFDSSDKFWPGSITVSSRGANPADGVDIFGIKVKKDNEDKRELLHLHYVSPKQYTLKNLGVDPQKHLRFFNRNEQEPPLITSIDCRDAQSNQRQQVKIFGYDAYGQLIEATWSDSSQTQSSGETVTWNNLGKLLPFKLQDQKKSNWCWAAVTLGILNFFDCSDEEDWSQCKIVKKILSPKSPYTEGFNSSDDWNKIGYLHEVLSKDGIGKDDTDSKKSKQYLEERVDFQRRYPHSKYLWKALEKDSEKILEQIGIHEMPVICRIGDNADEGHFIVIRGIIFDESVAKTEFTQGKLLFYQDASTFHIKDSLDPQRDLVLFKVLQDKYKDGWEWTDIYYLHNPNQSDTVSPS